ncbi:MAPK kinase substrate protein At1g80180-like [Impatiens glandulifera]|uniref:MAPK kinase substrate protein At1g80180-like n=1 Tax=Impatiens glandulifera TaxID=253017 RepID=UPI001FB09E3E|nr:MAPK kinase substrate protein At1g80180-like [Impatiens glandulifera]
MAGLQRSAISFRRQGSSGLIWDDKLISAELMKQKEEEEGGEKSKQDQNQNQKEEQTAPSPTPTPEQGRPPRNINTIERSRSNRAFRTGRVSPAIEPPSPRLSACGLCNGFGNKDKIRRRPKTTVVVNRRK